MSLPNVDVNGIRFGIISAGLLNQDLLQDLLYFHGRDLTAMEVASDYYEELGVVDGELTMDQERELEYRQSCIEEPTIEGWYVNVTYRTSWLGGALHIWILESPVRAWVRECSPCCPNAGDLDSLGELDEGQGVLTYSVPVGWLE
jgi:hypothetical protein